MKRDIYPVQLMIRRDRTPKGGDDETVVNSRSMWTSIKTRIESYLKNDIYLTDITGKTMSDYSISMQPIKLHYIDTGSLRDNRDLYCVFKWTIPRIPTTGLAYKSFVTNNIRFFTSGWFYVPDSIPSLITDAEWFPNQPSPRKWKVEREGGVTRYYNYDVTDDQIVTKQTEILFPEQILLNVLSEMIPNNTYGYQYDGFYRTLNYLLGELPDNPIKHSMKLDDDNMDRLITLEQGTEGDNIIEIYYDVLLRYFPHPF